jgi:hypothetical protein
MASVSSSFTDVGGGSTLLVKSGRELVYTLTGGATATLNIERSDNFGSSWEVIETVTADTGPTLIKNAGPSKAIYRFNCTAFTSGTAVGVIKDATEELVSRGTVPVTTVAVYEYGDVVARKTVLECNALSVTIADDAGVAQYGGVKVYDFPEGMLLFKGARVSGILTAGVTGTIIDNWDGDVALGSATATTGATLTGTEADLMPSVAVSAGASDKLGVVSAVSVATVLTESGARWMDGTATAKDLYLNFVIDDDATHTAGTATFTGTIEFNWEMLGDL